MTAIAQLQAAWKDLMSKLPSEQRAHLEKQAAAGHQHLLAIRRGSTDEARPVAREMMLVHSLLHDDPDGLLKDAATAAELKITHVGKDGGVYFGGVDYDLTDANWAYCPWAWHETGPTPAFNNSPAVVQIPDKVTLAILGDWGGNNSAAQQVAARAQAVGADYWVHLGDVYYAGTAEDGIIERDYQKKNFLDVWPGADGKSFNLNSNHDMYAHGTGYYNTALRTSIFSAQQGCGYFALFNTSFRFVGLDTAYFDPDQSGTGFMTGALGPTGSGTQARFLHDQAAAAAGAGQQLVLFSHHNGLSVDGLTPTPLWNEVAAQLIPLAGKQVIWYWGHEHLAAVYTPHRAGDVTVLPRCCGHGCIPWGVASALDSPNVVWAEKEVLGPGTDYFVTNGFATLKLEGSSLTESFFGQTNTAPHWTHPARAAAAPPEESLFSRLKRGLLGWMK